MNIHRILAVLGGGGVVTTLACAQLWTSNPSNPYDSVGFAIRSHIQAANRAFAYKLCKDPPECWVTWGGMLDANYHKDSKVHVLVDTALVKWTAKEQAFLDQMKAAISTFSKQQSFVQLSTIEHAIDTAYTGSTPEEVETQKSLFLMATSFKAVTSIASMVSAGPGSGPPLGFPTEAEINRCMVNAINNATLFDPLLDHGAGPGGWVLDNYLTCILLR